MTEKYLDLENGKVIEIEVFEGKGRRIFENENNIISKEKYKEINKDCPEIDEIISAYISDKNLKVKMLDDSEKWNLDEVKEYFIENEIYIQFYGIIEEQTLSKKAVFLFQRLKKSRIATAKCRKMNLFYTHVWKLTEKL